MGAVGGSDRSTCVTRPKFSHMLTRGRYLRHTSPFIVSGTMDCLLAISMSSTIHVVLIYATILYYVFVSFF